MSLGVKSLWRARCRIGLVPGLSLVGSRKSRSLLLSNHNNRHQSPFRCWLSSSITEARPSAIPKSEFIDQTDIFSQVETEPDPRTTTSWPELVKTSSTSTTARERAALRRAWKTRLPRSTAFALIKKHIQYPSRRASRRSLRKHRFSATRQSLHEYVSHALNKPPSNWRSTLDYMIRHTPKFGELLDFKVGIGKAAAVQARAALSELDTNLWHIQQRHHCKIRMDPGSHEDGPLIISLSGTNVSVRAALLDLVKVVGKVSAVRVLDPSLGLSSLDVWKGNNTGQNAIRLLSEGEQASEDETITIYGHTNTDFLKMAQRPYHKVYQLLKRADEIPPPAVWTKASFEQHVARLVQGRVPTHLHRALYPAGLDHQATVVQLLVELFSTEELRAAVSVTALKLALHYITNRGRVFRPEARAIFYQAELQQLPIDAEVYQIFLISASKAGDLQGFDSVLKAMHRKGHYTPIETWKAFLAMIQDPKVKEYIMRKMRTRGLQRLQPILEELGRQAVMLDLDGRVNMDTSVRLLVQTQDKEYGPSWLNTMTLNKMLDALGSCGNLEACHELIDLVVSTKRVGLDSYTLNTMMTHTRSIPQKVSLLSRWPDLRLNTITYEILFSTAWKQRLPNMLRVIWRYSAFAGLTSSKMRHNLTKLMGEEFGKSKNQAFLKAWEDVILGRSELAAARLAGVGAALLMKRYLWDANGMQPVVGLAAKLQEAYEMDMKIHKLNKEGMEMTGSMRESLTVDIPLGATEKQKHRVPSLSST